MKRVSVDVFMKGLLKTVANKKSVNESEIKAYAAKAKCTIPEPIRILYNATKTPDGKVYNMSKPLPAIIRKALKLKRATPEVFINMLVENGVNINAVSGSTLIIEGRTAGYQLPLALLKAKKVAPNVFDLATLPKSKVKAKTPSRMAAAKAKTKAKTTATAIKSSVSSKLVKVLTDEAKAMGLKNVKVKDDKKGHLRLVSTLPAKGKGKPKETELWNVSLSLSKKVEAVAVN